MTAWQLIRELSRFDPDSEIVICPMRRDRWKTSDEQDVCGVYAAGPLHERSRMADNTRVRIAGRVEKGGA